MRIKYVIPSKPSPSYINIEMWQMLVHELTVCDQVDIVDMSPDIVHIFGIWNMHNVRLVEQYRSKDIPVVFTSINGVLSIVNRDGRQVNSPNIIYAVRRIVRSSAIRSNDIAVRNRISRQIAKYNIQDKSIHDICTRLMYIRQRFKMLNIPQSVLDETSQVMIGSDYDEKSMRRALDEMHLSKFASYTMALLESNSSLTEGFMPIDSLDGKVVSDMQKLIIN